MYDNNGNAIEPLNLAAIESRIEYTSYSLGEF